VKTSTGFSTARDVEDVSLMSRIVREKGLGVKASGGVRSLADVMKMVAAGATRIGTSSGVKIFEGSRRGSGEFGRIEILSRKGTDNGRFTLVHFPG